MATVTGCQSDEWIEKNPKENNWYPGKKKKRIEKERRNEIFMILKKQNQSVK